MEIVKLDTIKLKDLEILEKQIQDFIATNPDTLGLGKNLLLLDKERVQANGGRLDLLLEDYDSNIRYEVEIQRGNTDPEHIIRSIEYWDIERKRYPNYEHVAVLVAENITSRFFNVIGLFSGAIPIVALQMNAVELSDNKVGLNFAKILDTRNTIGVQEDEKSEPSSKGEWEEKSSKESMQMADNIFEMAKTVDKNVNPNYTKYYISIQKNGTNFCIISLKKNYIIFAIKLEKNTENDSLIEDKGFVITRYAHNMYYDINLEKEDIDTKKEQITELLKIAYDKIIQ